MKKTVLLLISLLLSVMVCSAAHFEVFRTSGVVEVLRDGQWVSVKKREPLQSTDKVKIGVNSFVGIKDNKNKNIYYCSQPGETKVLSIIVSAKNQSKSTTSLLSGAVTSANSDKAGKKRQKVHGAVIRGGIKGRLIDSDDTADEDSVGHPTYKNSFGNMLNDIICDKVELTESDTLNIGLKLVVAPEDSLLTYVITDRIPIKDTKYINVLRITPGEAPQLMFDGGMNGENIYITDNSELTVDWYPSVYDPSARYLLIVCEEDFNPKNMQGLLDSAFKSRKTEIKQPAYIPTLHWNARTWVINSQFSVEQSGTADKTII